MVSAVSSLLTEEEHDRLVFLLGPRRQSLSTSVAQLLFGQPPDFNMWAKWKTGVVTFTKDSNRRSFFLQLYDLKVTLFPVKSFAKRESFSVLQNVCPLYPIGPIFLIGQYKSIECNYSFAFCWTDENYFNNEAFVYNMWRLIKFINTNEVYDELHQRIMRNKNFIISGGPEYLERRERDTAFDLQLLQTLTVDCCDEDDVPLPDRGTRSDSYGLPS